jgi:hypothetical protein
MSPVTEILWRLNPLFGHRKWNLTGVNEKTLRRWFNGDESPSPAGAKAVAASLWADLERAKSMTLREEVYHRIREVVPDAPCGAWTEVTFAAWFHELAQGGGKAAVLPSRKPGANPFTSRSPVYGEDFFGREQELRKLQDFICKRQSMHIVGARKMGKSSLLREAAERISEWAGTGALARLDMCSTGVQTQAGWRAHVARQWVWETVPRDGVEFSNRLQDELNRGMRKVLILDEFDVFARLAREFPLEFFEDLRACGQAGLAMLTTSHMTLREIRRAGARLSPYYNTFALMDLGPWTGSEALEFVSRRRPDCPALLSTEAEAILQFGGNHPFRLQLACYHVIEARWSGTVPTQGLAFAQREWEESGMSSEGEASER